MWSRLQVAAYREECNGTALIITHNTRILEHLQVDRAHVMVSGSLVDEGDADLIREIDSQGFARYGVTDAGEAADAADDAAADAEPEAEAVEATDQES